MDQKDGKRSRGVSNPARCMGMDVPAAVGFTAALSRILLLLLIWIFMELLVVSVLHSPVCPTLLCGGVFVKSCFPLQSWEINEDDSHIFLPSIPPFPPAPWQTQILAACSRHQKVYKPCLPGSGLCRTQMIQIMQMTAASRGRRSWTCWEGREIS